MKRIRLKELVLIALFADIGFIAKRVISPLGTAITDFLRVPGGIGTSFALMFLVIGAYLIQKRGAGALMGFLQFILALSLGMTGAMGLMSIFGYVVPGIVIDLVILICQKACIHTFFSMCAANMAGSVAASLVANIIVFHLQGAVLVLYLLVGIISGALCGAIAYLLVKRLRPLYLRAGLRKPDTHTDK